MTPKRGKWVSKHPTTRRNQISPTVTPVADLEKILKDAKGKQRSIEATSQLVKKVHKKYIPNQNVHSSNLESKEVSVSKDLAEKSKIETASLEDKVDIVNLSSAKSFSHSSIGKLEISK